MNEIKIELTVPGKFTKRRVSPQGIAALRTNLRKEITTSMMQVESEIKGRLVFHFNRMIRERPRNPNYRNGSSEMLQSRMIKAYLPKLVVGHDEIKLFMFNLTYMDAVTRNEGKKTRNQGWFGRFADGHSGRKHGSLEWGFIRYDFAMELAHSAAERFISDPAERMSWLQEMADVFQGRHLGDENGIMVHLDRPLFFKIPQFGKAGEFVARHIGYKSWPAAEMTAREIARSNSSVMKIIKGAVNRAAERTM